MKLLKTNLDKYGVVEYQVEFGLFRGELSEVELGDVMIEGQRVPLTPELVYELSKDAEKQWHRSYKDEYSEDCIYELSYLGIGDD